MDFKCQHCKKILRIENPEILKQIKPESLANCIYCQGKTAIVPIEENTPPPTPNTDDDPTKIDAPDEFGWLMVHDENTPKQTFNLKLGNNIIGRKSSKPTDVLIETNDVYMSRNHCCLTVVLNPNHTLSYVIKDMGSANSTYLNGTKLKNDDLVYIEDGDTIQIGRTKVILKTVKRTPIAEQDLGRQSFGKTIIA